MLIKYYDCFFYKESFVITMTSWFGIAYVWHELVAHW